MGNLFGRKARTLPGQGKGGKWCVLGVGAALLGSVAGWPAPALADDKSSDTFAGDYAAGAAGTPGTFVVVQYAGVSHSEAFAGPIGPKSQPGSGANTYEEFTRFIYASSLFGHPFFIEGEIPFATLTDVKFDTGTGVKRQDVAGGLADPVLHLSYYLIADPHNERALAFTNYFYLPAGRSFDNLKAVNVSTPRQFTDVPQIGYAEGLGKFSRLLKGVSLDIVANASLHTDGDSPVAVAPGIQFNKLVQDTSYDFRAYLRYNWNPLGFVAVGYEGSWGGKQTAEGGLLQQALGGPLVLAEDNYQRGHVQAQMPLAADTAIAADVFHDFSAKGGFREDIGVELRLTKIFAPEAPMPMK